MEKRLPRMKSSGFLLSLCLSFPFLGACDHSRTGDLAVGQSPRTSSLADQLPEILLKGPDLRIGVLDGGGPDLFGLIHTVFVDPTGDFMVLDRDEKTVRWFGVDGRFRGSAGREGEGPGEFQVPRIVVSDTAGLIQVYDAGLRRLTSYQRTDSGFSYVGDRPIEPSIQDLCLISGRTYLHTPGREAILGEIDGEGAVIRSFGEQLMVRDNDEIAHLWDRPIGASLRQYQNQGKLLCSESPPRIVVVPEMMPWIRAFDPRSEELLWTTTLEDFHPIHFMNPGGTAVSLAPDPVSGTSHHLQSVAWIDSMTFAATYRESGLTDREGTLEIRVFSLSTGEEIHRIRSSHFGLSGVTRDGRIVGFTNYPFPQIGVFLGESSDAG